ncbi:MMPL family transporter [Paenibacillus sp. FJAT-26967]|uniref:MMPL family transporter n=1 Tax=Paenibacillus sp. FJAT-26967 TaxID=1729690 RepID=UPI0008384646|nr:MMPL family transporter [Paenibacillus sp. FJAT-26967]
MKSPSFVEGIVSRVAGPRSKWVTVAAWILVTVLLTLVFPGVNSQENNAADQLPSDSLSVKAAQLQKEQFPGSGGNPALVVFYRQAGLSDSDLSALQKIAGQLTEQPLPQQTAVPPYHKMPLQALKQSVSEDGTSIVLPITFDAGADSDKLKESTQKLSELSASVIGSDPFAVKELNSDGLIARVTGPVGIGIDATGLFKGADFSLLMATVVLVLVLLILLYRSPVMAIVPLVGVGFAYGVISPILGKMAELGWIVVDAQTISIMTVLLFGAGTDYCLFFAARYRTALLEQKSKHQAVKEALFGSGGAIGMSGLTVIVSMLALIFARYGSNHRFAIPFSLAIFIMVLASITLVPAILGILGRKSFYPFAPLTPEMRAEKEAKRGRPVKEQHAVGRLSELLGRLVVTKPKTILTASLILLIVLAGFSTQIKYTYNLLASFPETMPSREGFKLLSDHYSPGSLAPVKVMVDTEGKAVDAAAALKQLPYVESVSEPVKGKTTPDIVAYEVLLKEDPFSNESIGHIPDMYAASEAVLKDAGISDPGSRVWISGQTAEQYDTEQITGRDTKVVIPIVISIIALLLLVYLRSIVATIYLMATVLLSYFSALGAGWLILNTFFGTDAIQGLIPLYAFVFLVALGEDYNIFMVSGIWKASKKHPLKEAIRIGVSTTSSVITSAGLILAGTFAVLSVLPIQVLVQFGVICAVGVLLDTFIVRPFLVPTITLLLGKAAFWPAKPEGPAAAAEEGR